MSATRSTSGVCFFDVADQYGSHTYLREALKGVPRDQYVIQTKTHATNVADARSHLERYRMELGVDYIDIVLLHCMTKDGWPAENQGSMEYLMQAKEEKIIRAHGTSCHGMDPLRTAAKTPFVEIDLARINPEGLIMDDKKPDEVASVLEEMHNAGKGVVGMKILGEGRIKTPERKDASLRYVLGLGTVERLHHRLRVPRAGRRPAQAHRRRHRVPEGPDPSPAPPASSPFSPGRRCRASSPFAFSPLSPGRCRAAADEGPADRRKRPCGEGHPLALPVPVPLAACPEPRPLASIVADTNEPVGR